MRVIYYAILGGVAIFLCYATGMHVGNVKCSAKMANANAELIIWNTKIIEKTNEKVIHTGVGDMRRILRQKYTIAE